MQQHPRGWFRLALPLLMTLAVLLAPGRTAWTQREEGPVIAAASSLQFALDELAARFTERSGEPVRLSFGSSGNIARQIRQGAPFDLFLSADERFAEMLVESGHSVDAGAVYAIGRLAIVAPPGSPVSADAELEGLRTALSQGQVHRFSIANPEHAPYGQRAEEALRHAGLWEAVKPLLVLGENVSQAAQFAASGSTDGGLVAYSLVRSTRIGEQVDFALIPEDWHSPLRQRMVLIEGADATARAFYDYLRGEEARAVLETHGFAAPE